jgi:hypothetical protein
MGGAHYIFASSPLAVRRSQVWHSQVLFLHRAWRGEAMSKNNNVNPGQYKVAGRDKPGKPRGIENESKEARARATKDTDRFASKQKKG